MTLNDEVRKLTTEYILRYIELELEMKKIKCDMKALKEEYEEQGLKAAKVLKAYKMCIAEHKLGDKINELDAYKNVISSNTEIADKITELNSKLTL